MAGGNSRTDSLSIIPTMPEERKVEKKKSKEDSRKPSWSIFSSRGKEERDEAHRREEESAKRAKAKSPRPGDESSSGRLDVLQQQIDGVKPRESLVLDRNSIRLEEERKKESNRKSGDSGGKKEKDGIFSSLFSSKKKDKDSSGKSKQRGLSPEPPLRILKPDVDYNWTRFSIMEERAIYRMAHIKLANPRRELYSQVLLSNFMYSYLAKVQSQHPQMQVAADPRKQQRPGMKKDSQQRQQQPEEYSQYQRYQQVSQLNDSSGTQLLIPHQQQEQQAQQQAQQQSPQQYQQTQEDAYEDGASDQRVDPRASQHNQYPMQHQQQHQHHQSYGSSNGGYSGGGGGGGGYGGGRGGGGAPVVSSSHSQGGPVNYLNSHNTQRGESLASEQGNMW